MVRSVTTVIICLFFSACCKPAEDARELLTKLYTSYEKNFLNVNIGSKEFDSLLTPELLRLIHLDLNRPEGENGYLNWDPLCDCQDPDGVHLDTIVVSQKSGTVSCEVLLKYLGKTKTIHYELVKANEKWLIRDIGSKSVSSLYNFLLGNLKKDLPDSVRNLRLK